MLASQPSLDIYDALEITYWHAIHASQATSTKINCSTFFIPHITKMQICTMRTRLISMRSSGLILRNLSAPVQVVDKKRPVGVELSQL